MSGENFFPSWRYHKTESARIFASAEEVAAAGAGWVDTPAKFADETASAVESVPSAPAVEAPVAAPAPVKKTRKKRK